MARAVPLSGVKHIDGLLYGHSWTGKTGAPAQVTYSYAYSDWTYASSSSRYFTDFSTLNTVSRHLADAALGAYENIANITFRNTGTLLGDDTDIVLRQGAGARFNGIGDTTYGDNGYIDDVPKAKAEHADIIFRSFYTAGTPEKGEYAYVLILHEIGHTLGLAHPHDGGAVGYEHLHGDDDSYRTTVMSYNESNYNVMPVTPMLYDIAAMQYLYGANDGYTSGDTVYRYNGENTSDGGSYTDALRGKYDFIGETLWDGGGEDTIDASFYQGDAKIDLREGKYYYSEIGEVRVWNAFGANIENATGGAGDDTLIGNAGDNIFTGGAGDDFITGKGGADTVDYSAARGGVTVSLADEKATGEGADILRGISHIIGSRNNDKLEGDSGANRIEGDGGDDSIDGREGADILKGGSGNDTLYADDADDSIDGGEGGDTLSFLRAGGAVNIDFSRPEGAQIRLNGDTLRNVDNIERYEGGARADRFEGDSGNNDFAGAGGNDLFALTPGDDRIEGGTGADTVSAAGAGVAANINLAEGYAALLRPGSAKTLFNSVEDAEGGAFADTVKGDNSANILQGGGGDDALFGGAGEDTLRGGTGDDTLGGGIGADSLYGGDGADIFYFGLPEESLAGEEDTISGFIAGEDKIALLRYGFGGEADTTVLYNGDNSEGTAAFGGGMAVRFTDSDMAGFGESDIVWYG